MDLAAAHALIRFGLGGRAGEPPPADPKAWLLRQLATPDTGPGDSPTTAEGLAALRADRQNRPTPEESQSRRLFRAGVQACIAHAVATDTPFRERLVWFWANHFTVSVRRGACAAVLPGYVAEAVRPHVTGRFADMLLAVMRHPAMLLYLDNVASIGPDSPAGARTHRGLNENLARECLELHTMSPAGGYTQTDVTGLAAILTGWSIDLRSDPPGFRFRPGAHEPGELSILGRRFAAGEAGGLAALDFLAGHPATYRFIAGKLVRHFVADDPTPADVRQVAAVLTDTRGDLGAAAAALVRLDSAWRPLTKLRAPQDMLVAGFRTLDLPPAPPGALQATLAGIGQPLWSAPAPNGWPDRASDWAAPDAMVRRADWAYAIAGRTTADPDAVAAAALGPLLRPATRQAMHQAGSRRDALTLLFTSPEFQRR